MDNKGNKKINNSKNRADEKGWYIPQDCKNSGNNGEDSAYNNPEDMRRFDVYAHIIAPIGIIYNLFAIYYVLYLKN